MYLYVTVTPPSKMAIVETFNLAFASLSCTQALVSMGCSGSSFLASFSARLLEGHRVPIVQRVVYMDVNGSFHAQVR